MEPAHLNNEAIVRAGYGLVDASTASHLDRCGDCRAAVGRVQTRRRQAADTGAVEELPAAFWQRQRQMILSGVREPRVAFRPVPAAVALASLAALAVLLVRVPSRQATLPPTLVPRSAASAVQPDRLVPATPDDQLLRDIRGMVNRTEPRALAPMALLFSQRAKEDLRP